MLRPSLLCLLLVACADRAPVHVQASFQSGVPLQGLEVSALPFDANGVLDSLARVAPTPRPVFPAIEARIQAYRRRDPGAAEVSTSAAWIATRDSVARLAGELSRQDRRADGYRDAYARFRRLYARYVSREAEREGRLRSLFAGDRAVAEDASRASDSLRAWEREAYRAFPALADARVALAGRPIDRVRTDSLGSADFDLPGGKWWVTARIADPDNPFQEFHWNLPVRVTAGLPFGLPLIRANATVRWRH